MLEPSSRQMDVAYEMVGIRQAIDELELQFCRLAAEFDRGDYWDQEGSNSPIDWIRFNCHMTSNAAGTRIAVGENLARMAESAQAMQSGEIGFTHLTSMARTANAVGKAFDEKKLLELARESSPGKFHYRCLHYRHSVQPKVVAAEQAELAESNFLHLNTQDDGCLFFTGCLDPVGGAVVRNALESFARKSGADDYREAPKRWADALVGLASTRTKIQLQVTSSVETLLDVIGAPGAETQFSLPISSKTVERWACDSSLTRILMQDSVVIDVGRAERTIKGPRRRALIARDQHCRWTGCERPASHCDGHHVVHWLHGGGGEIENQVLLCRRHHWMVHEGGWQLIKADDGHIITVGPTFTFGLARGPD
ncbi:MAG TPA: DUF222 domain-containing protein [Candidatus Dormibacteraeota bacterium]|nr:DUF222 domain-containing protein [Candidatus Dormibacteraeota bacterium]